MANELSPVVQEYDKTTAAIPASSTPPKPDKLESPAPAPDTSSNVVPFKPAGGEGVQGAIKDIADLEKYRQTIAPPKLERPNKPQTATDDIQLWGSLAIVFAAIASRRTRTPMTTALNAAAAAVQGMREGSKERVDQAYKQWEMDMNFALQNATFEQRAYDELMNQITTKEELRYKAGQAQDAEAFKREIFGFREQQAATGNAFKREDLTRKEEKDKETEENRKTLLVQGQEKIEEKAKFDRESLRIRKDIETDKVKQNEALLKFKTMAAALHDAPMLQVLEQGEAEGGFAEGVKRAAELNNQRREQADKLKSASEKITKAKQEQEIVDEMKQTHEWQKAVAAGDHDTQLRMLIETQNKMHAKTGSNIVPWPQPLIDSTAQDIVAGRKAPLTGSNLFGRGAANNPNVAAVMQKVHELDPDYDTTLWDAKKQAVKALLGKDGDQIRSFTVLVHHLEFFDTLAKELKNSPNRPENQVITEVARQFGMPEVTNFDLAKLIVGQEILKATAGSTETGEDRAKIAEALDRANSPEQLAEVSRVIKTLASGQLSGQLSKYRKLIDKGWLTDSDVVPQDAMDRLGFTHTQSGAVLRPGGQSLFDRGWAVEKTGTSIPSPSTPVSDKEIPKEQAVKEAPKGAEQTVQMKDGSWVYKVNGKWVHADGTSVQ